MKLAARLAAFALVAATAGVLLSQRRRSPRAIPLRRRAMSFQVLDTRFSVVASLPSVMP